MTILRKAKDNLFIVIVAAAYIVMFLVRPDMGVASVKNSVYYIKEMIMIMPVIFVLTALLDTWIPKQQIMRFLGRGAGIKGAVFALVLGSVSAGPIYAAFPLCVMLQKKGASIRNLVIILSAWAVIKVPMLLNEMKFMGLRFMAVRWALTVIAILVFSWITSRIVRDRDLPEKAAAPEKRKNRITVNQSACMGCSLCVRQYPELFRMEHQKAAVQDAGDEIDKEKLALAIDGCPVRAITVLDNR